MGKKPQRGSEEWEGLGNGKQPVTSKGVLFGEGYKEKRNGRA